MRRHAIYSHALQTVIPLRCLTLGCLWSRARLDCQCLIVRLDHPAKIGRLHCVLDPCVLRTLRIPSESALCPNSSRPITISADRIRWRRPSVLRPWPKTSLSVQQIQLDADSRVDWRRMVILCEWWFLRTSFHLNGKQNNKMNTDLSATGIRSDKPKWRNTYTLLSMDVVDRMMYVLRPNGGTFARNNRRNLVVTACGALALKATLCQDQTGATCDGTALSSKSVTITNGFDT